MASTLTQRQATAAYQAIVARFADCGVTPVAGTFRQGGDPWPDGPVLVEGFEGWHSTTRWAIVWEGGPYEWVHSAEISPATPDGVFAEPFNGFALALHPA